MKERLKQLGSLLRAYPAAICFLVFITGFMVLDMCWPTREFSELENTMLDQKPAFSFQALFSNEWTADYGEYVKDQIALRDSWIDLQSRTAVDLSWVGDAHADAIVAEPSPAERPRKIREVHPTRTTEHRVVYSDIDFNRHVNTMRYIEMMLDMLPVELLTLDAPMRLDIHFLHECRFGQTLRIGCEERERAALFEISADDGVAAVRAGVEWR